MKQRGTQINPFNRFERVHNDRSFYSDELFVEDEYIKNPQQTQVKVEFARSVLSYNRSPDVPFDVSLNPYRGCEHGCIYCFARPSHAYLDLSPGIDFETQLYAKTNAAEVFEREINHKNYTVEPVSLGINTDCYQPIEKKYKITRQILSLCVQYQHPVSIVTKSALILRDLDLIEALSSKNLISVAISHTTLDNKLKAIMEPQTASGKKRLAVMKELTNIGVPVSALLAPIIPKINDSEIEDLLSSAVEHGATHAAYVFIRLPHELKELFSDWLARYFPERAQAVLSMIKQSSSGKLYNSNYATRMSGEGVFSEMIASRFNKQCEKLKLNQAQTRLDKDLFKRRQLELF